MKAVRFSWPEGKMGAFTTSWDDGTIHDRRLVPILNRYGIKGTWNLCSGWLGRDFKNSGGASYVTAEEIPQLYAGHEVACHSVNHLNLTQTPEGVIQSELLWDRQCFEAIMKAPVLGLAYPFGATNEIVSNVARNCGVVYARSTADSQSFEHPGDFLNWHPTRQIDDHFPEVWEDFSNRFWDGKLLYAWGHSFEFDPDRWGQVEDFCRLAGNHPQIWYATNMEVCEYITAWRSMGFSADLSFAKNNSYREIWYRSENSLEKIQPGEIRGI